MSGDLATFDVLKDSDAEQFQLDDYAGGVNAIAPLNEADRKAILYTKLMHRQRFRQVLADSRLMSGELSAGERERLGAAADRVVVLVDLALGRRCCDSRPDCVE